MTDHARYHYRKALRKVQGTACDALWAYRADPTAAGRELLLLTAHLLRELTRMTKQIPPPGLPILQVDSTGIPIRFSPCA